MATVREEKGYFIVIMTETYACYSLLVELRSDLIYFFPSFLVNDIPT